MDTETVRLLCTTTTDFYRHNAASFSATRNLPWPGWTSCLEVIGQAWLQEGDFGEGELGRGRSRKAGLREGGGLAVFDLACGNLRFENFLTKALPTAQIEFYTVDTCDELLPQLPVTNHQRLDILAVLQRGLSLNEQITAPPCDLSVAFGLMHHVPLRAYREEVLASLLRQTHPGGCVAVSLWQFARDAALRNRAQDSTARAVRELELSALEDNDYLLGWQNLPHTYRYCHSFTDAEIDQLIESVAKDAVLLSRFTSDGRTDDLNTYLIFEVPFTCSLMAG
jgi:SAM-dependent methyltransferase